MRSPGARGAATFGTRFEVEAHVHFAVTTRSSFASVFSSLVTRSDRTRASNQMNREGERDGNTA
jgi:hypothetical protein